MTLKKKHNNKKYMTSHKINFHYFIFQNVPNYVQPNLPGVNSVFLCDEHLFYFGNMLI